MGQPRVIIADDDVLLREGLASLLDRSGMQVLGQAGDAQQFLDLVDQHLPDLVLVDIRMLPTNTTEGLAAARTIRQTHPQVGIVVLSVHVAVELVATRRRDPPGVLSPREREVLGLMAEAAPMRHRPGGCGSPKAPWRSTSGPS
jgi:CheY-like chemotaxis protein